MISHGLLQIAQRFPCRQVHRRHIQRIQREGVDVRPYPWTRTVIPNVCIAVDARRSHCLCACRQRMGGSGDVPQEPMNKSMSVPVNHNQGETLRPLRFPRPTQWRRTVTAVTGHNHASDPDIKRRPAFFLCKRRNGDEDQCTTNGPSYHVFLLNRLPVTEPISSASAISCDSTAEIRRSRAHRGSYTITNRMSRREAAILALAWARPPGATHTMSSALFAYF